MTWRSSRRSAWAARISGRSPCERLRPPASSNIVTIATTSKRSPARDSAAQLSLPPLHEIAARGLEANAQTDPDRATERAIAERFHVVRVRHVVHRQQHRYDRADAVRPARVPRRVTGVLDNRRVQQHEVAVDESPDEDAGEVGGDA